MLRDPFFENRFVFCKQPLKYFGIYSTSNTFLFSIEVAANTPLLLEKPLLPTNIT